ncbi:MAG: hypothetical protein EOO61_07915 [Hymenobacter sp.]|nr:MAG: hypothetical protein EOO61_07915 [Hymenobacter sp.]
MIEVFIPIVATGLFILMDTKARWEMEAFEKKQAQGRARIEEMKKIAKDLDTDSSKPNPTTMLVIELLRADTDWSERRKDFGNYTLEHITGVKLLYENAGAGKTITKQIMVKNSAGSFVSVEVSKDEKAKISVEINAFKTRQRDAEQVDLARALAERVKARELGEVHPLLGFSGVSEGAGVPLGDTDSLGSKRTDADAVSSRYLVREGDKIVYVGREDSKRSRMSEELEVYYGLK